MTKKALSAILVIALLFSISYVSAFAESGTVSVYFNSELMVFDVPPKIVNSRTLVPMRAIFEKLGAIVTWDGDYQTAGAYSYDNQKGVSITVGTNLMVDINKNTVYLDAPAILENGRTLVPLRAISEAFDCDVSWDGSTKTVTIYSEDFLSYLNAAKNQKTVTAATVSELLYNIGSNKKVILTADYYNLSDTQNIDNPFVEKNSYDDGYTVKNVSNMTIEGDAEIAINDIMADVLLFVNCENITLSELRIGHTESAEKYRCEGAVTRFQDCSNIFIKNCNLYGCGAFGVYADGVGSLNVSDCKIYDCSYTGIWLTGNTEANVNKTEFCDSNHMSGFLRIDNSKISLYDCNIHDISCEPLIQTLDFDGKPSEISIKNSDFSNVNFEKLINSDTVNVRMSECHFTDKYTG